MQISGTFPALSTPTKKKPTKKGKGR